MAKKTQPKETKDKDNIFEQQDFDLFKALDAIDRKDYNYYDNLTQEQQKKFSPYQLIQWLSAVKGNHNLQIYYLQSTEIHANKYLLDYMISSKEHNHPKLVWLMLCAASPGIGKQFHQWVPKISEKTTLLKEPAKQKDIEKYYKKIYPKATDADITAVSKAYVEEQKKKLTLAKRFPNLKYDDIELLSKLVSDDDIKQYARDNGDE
jgi:hypothetical protein